jgi:Lambda phage tail tube protein, TTP
MAKRLTNVIKLLRGNGASPEVFTDNVGNVVDFNGPTYTNDRIEVTDGDSPANSKEYLPARQDPGPLTLTLNFDPDNSFHQDILEDIAASPPTTRNYRLRFSDEAGDYFTGPAFYASFAASGNTRGQPLQAAVGLQPTTSWTLVAGA